MGCRMPKSKGVQALDYGKGGGGKKEKKGREEDLKAAGILCTSCMLKTKESYGFKGQKECINLDFV